MDSTHDYIEAMVAAMREHERDMDFLWLISGAVEEWLENCMGMTRQAIVFRVLCVA